MVKFLIKLLTKRVNVIITSLKVKMSCGLKLHMKLLMLKAQL